MNGNKLVADTSLIINLFNGNTLARDVIHQRQPWLSCITEIELLSFPKLSTPEKQLLNKFLDECVILDLTKTIRDATIKIRSSYQLKIPDAIIAATAHYLDLPLVTFDHDFKKIENLDLVLLEND